ncbi:MAG: CAP domain-containing protein [Terracidiphilus sp.]|jgi:hypothetical protein
MRILRQGAILSLALGFAVFVPRAYGVSNSLDGDLLGMPGAVARLFTLANQTRAEYGLGSLRWDPALAAGALQHCLHMTQAASLSHQYRGEPEVAMRAARAGAHFSLIEENIAIGPYAGGVHQGWMNSPGHRANLLNPVIDRVGIAVLARGGELYAVADYARAVPVLTQAQVEAAFADMLRARGVAVLRDAKEARALCTSSGRFMPSDGASILMRWQGSDVTQLPAELARHVASGEYRQAAVGSCPAQNVDGGFTAFRVAVLLYGANTAALP